MALYSTLDRKFVLSLKGNTMLCALTRRDREEVGVSLSKGRRTWEGHCEIDWNRFLHSKSLHTRKLRWQVTHTPQSGHQPFQALVVPLARKPTPRRGSIQDGCNSSCSRHQRPWLWRSRKANIEDEQALRTWETWSDRVSFESRRTPRTLSDVTLSAPSMRGWEGIRAVLDLWGFKDLLSSSMHPSTMGKPTVLGYVFRAVIYWHKIYMAHIYLAGRVS